MPYTDPVTVVTGQVMQASDWNTYVRDNMRSMNRWVAYTPIWSASGTNPSIGNGHLVGHYIKFEQICFIEIHITLGTTSSVGTGVWFFLLPFPSHTASIANYRQNLPIVILNDAVAWFLDQQATIDSGANHIVCTHVSDTAPFTWGALDV